MKMFTMILAMLLLLASVGQATAQCVRQQQVFVQGFAQPVFVQPAFVQQPVFVHSYAQPVFVQRQAFAQQVFVHPFAQQRVVLQNAARGGRTISLPRYRNAVRATFGVRPIGG
jgi:hypothetical protein